MNTQHYDYSPINSEISDTLNTSSSSSGANSSPGDVEMSSLQGSAPALSDFGATNQTPQGSGAVRVVRARNLPPACSKRSKVILLVIFTPIILAVLSVLVLLTIGVIEPQTELQTGGEVSCESDKWRCDNKLECIDLKAKCDGVNDCSDLTDEMNCKGGCQLRETLYFHCASGNCIKKSWQCDREEDCAGGDDEWNCNKCDNSTEYVCRDYSCVNETLRCDGRYDCKDRSDEYSCLKHDSETVKYLYDYSWIDLCYTDEVARLAGRLCAQLGHRSEGAAGSAVPRDDNSVPGVILTAWTDPNNTGGYDVTTRICNEATHLQCKSCGESTKQIWVGYLVGGTGGFPISDHPWHVKLRIANSICGGSLISDNWLLTAAHCVVNVVNSPGSVSITYGTNRFDGSGGIHIVAKKIILHPDYHDTIYTQYFATYSNDIALIQIDRISFSLNVQPICLPTIDDVPTDETTCFITGFGDITKHPFDAHYPTHLQEGKSRVWSKSKCQWFYKEYKLDITPDMICGGYHTGAIDSCGGDSGGPLICFMNRRWVLIGVTSWGTTCYQAAPSIYSRVSNAMPWIHEHISGSMNT